MRSDGGPADAGWSLLEMMAVVAILGVLTALAVATYAMTSSRAERVACEWNRREVGTAAGRYASEHDDRYPTSLDDLAAYLSGDEWRSCPADRSVAIALDPATGAATCPLHPAR